MRIGYLGDIVGTPGRVAASHAAAVLRREHRCDLLIANAENCAQGSGLTPEQHAKLTTTTPASAGFDGLTLGDHAFRKQQLKHTLDTAGNLIRPLNLPANTWGQGAMVLQPDTTKPAVHVVMLMGRLFMTGPQADDPYAALDAYLITLRNQSPRPIVLVEIHAEATSEKVAMGWHANGRVAAVVGSHTHVPTADARVLPMPHTDPSLPTHPDTRHASPGQGTAYLTDLGMTGPIDSVLGRRADRVVKYMTTATPAAFDVAEGRPTAVGVLIDIDDHSALATAITRVEIALPARDT